MVRVRDDVSKKIEKSFEESYKDKNGVSIVTKDETKYWFPYKRTPDFNVERVICINHGDTGVKIMGHGWECDYSSSIEIPRNVVREAKSESGYPLLPDVV